MCLNLIFTSNCDTIVIQKEGLRCKHMAQLGIRVDDKLKEEATELFDSLGLDMTTAVRMFLTQAVITKSIPFEIKKVSISEDEF